MRLEDRLNDIEALGDLSGNALINSDIIHCVVGRQLGSGVSRVVYEYNLDPDNYVIKIEPENYGCNRSEFDLWDEVSYYTGNLEWIKNWFAPCLWISPSGRVLVQS